MREGERENLRKGGWRVERRGGSGNHYKSYKTNNKYLKLKIFLNKINP